MEPQRHILGRRLRLHDIFFFKLKRQMPCIGAIKKSFGGKWFRRHVFYALYSVRKTFVRLRGVGPAWGIKTKQGRSWVLRRRLAEDYSRFREIQSPDLTCRFSPPVTMPTAPANYYTALHLKIGAFKYQNASLSLPKDPKPLISSETYRTKCFAEGGIVIHLSFSYIYFTGKKAENIQCIMTE